MGKVSAVRVGLFTRRGVHEWEKVIVPAGGPVHRQGDKLRPISNFSRLQRVWGAEPPN
ncbi:uncharacterized protein METZ01_LOCUS10883 [marine metagenome]|uniref:Uncharacterized protein n=1 Tax=marine metagenome TaxID=408172 RepID=A0A381NUU6_9ZZZZ